MTEYLRTDAHGRQITNDPPPERIAAERERQLEAARKIAAGTFRDFGPRIWVFVDKPTGVEYRRLESAVLLNASTAHLSNIACFTLDAGGQLHFLRRRGAEAIPLASEFAFEVPTARQVMRGNEPLDWRIR